MSDDALRGLLAAQNHGVLATIRRDGRPQMSVVNYAYDVDTDLIRISITQPRAKTRNLRRDPRAGLHVTSPDGAAWVVADGAAELSAVAAVHDDTTVDALVDHYLAVWGEHPDWADFRAAMVRDQRVLLRLPVTRVYGQPPMT